MIQEVLSAIASPVVPSQKCEQKKLPGRPTYSTAWVVRSCCRNMTAAAARVASKVPTTRATYNPTAMSRLLASAAVAPEHDVYGLNLDLTGWSPSFALVPQLRRMKCVNDLIASEVSNKVIFTLLRVRAIIFEDSVLLGSGVSVNGFPMGWLPSLDSLMPWQLAGMHAGLMCSSRQKRRSSAPCESRDCLQT